MTGRLQASGSSRLNGFEKNCNRTEESSLVVKNERKESWNFAILEPTFQEEKGSFEERLT